MEKEMATSLTEKVFVFDRSRRNVDEHCPRKRFWEYEYQGTGIVKKSLGIPLVTGQLVHKGLEKVLKLAREGRMPEFGPLLAELEGEYRGLVETKGLFSDSFDGLDEAVGTVIRSPNWQVEEQIALMVALILGWCGVRLPGLLAEFEIVDVEREERVKFFGGSVDPYTGILMTRCDAVIRRRATKELFVLNFKTVSEPNQTWLKQWAYDPQVLIEAAAVESRVDEPVAGVIIEGLVKGKRNIQHPRDSGQWRHNSPLIYGWKKEAMPFVEYAARYEYKDEFGKSRRLGPGYQRFAVWEEMTIREWLGKLKTECPEVLQAQFIGLPAVLSSPLWVNDWLQSAFARERAIYEAVSRNSITPSNNVFPKHTSNAKCLRPSQCPYLGLCWGVDDPDDRELYQIRVPNHPEEL